MNKLKEKIINMFFEEDNGEEEKKEDNIEIETKEEVSSKVIIIKMIVSSTIVINFILNIIYVSLFCYSGVTKKINEVVFIISFIWAIISLISSYKLDGKYSRLLFYLNVLIMVFISKLWFVYL